MSEYKECPNCGDEVHPALRYGGHCSQTCEEIKENEDLQDQLEHSERLVRRLTEQLAQTIEDLNYQVARVEIAESKLNDLMWYRAAKRMRKVISDAHMSNDLRTKNQILNAEMADWVSNALGAKQ